MMRSVLLIALVAASAGPASAFSTVPALAPARLNGAAVCYMQASAPASSSSRRGFLRLATAAVPAILGAKAPASAAAAETPVPGIVSKVLQTIAGGTQAELDAFQATPKVSPIYLILSPCTFTRLDRGRSGMKFGRDGALDIQSFIITLRGMPWNHS
jgi:hypothetical protein